MSSSEVPLNSGSPIILDGKMLSALLQDHIRAELQKANFSRRPGLAVVLVGDNPASLSYIKRKEKVAEEVGFKTFDYRYSADISQLKLSSELRAIAENSEVDGVLLQLPLPKSLDADEMIRVLGSKVDADGLHPLHQGMNLLGLHGTPRPCTPQGAMALIDLAFCLRKNGSQFPLSWPLPVSDLSGLNAVVIGRSALVGKPVAMMLLERNATVTVLHSRTQDKDVLCRQADIIVAAVGVPGLVKKDWIKPGAIIIDVGINRLSSGKLVGDVAYDEVLKFASAITPVPGGVGPMTVAMLLYNTWNLFLRNMNEEG